METVKYLCEFFFCHFWHWLGLTLLAGVIFGGVLFRINSKNKED